MPNILACGIGILLETVISTSSVVHLRTFASTKLDMMLVLKSLTVSPQDAEHVAADFCRQGTVIKGTDIKDCQHQTANAEVVCCKHLDSTTDYPLRSDM